MREWHKPTIEETESGMEVTSYLPAELDRALNPPFSSRNQSERRSGVRLIAVRAFGDACLSEQATDGPSTCTDCG